MVDDLVYPFFQIIVGAFSHFQERARQQFERAQDVANGRLGRHGTMEAWRFFFVQWIGLRENLQENPIFNGKIYGFL
jgi:hypothetical protein